MKADRLSDRAIVEHYADLAKEFPAMQPMLPLVERLSAKEYARSVAAGTSHDALCISGPDGEIASVVFDPERLQFLVQYRGRESRVTRQWCEQAEIAETLFENFVLRLLIKNRG